MPIQRKELDQNKLNHICSTRFKRAIFTKYTSHKKPTLKGSFTKLTQDDFLWKLKIPQSSTNMMHLENINSINGSSATCH